MKKEDEDEEDDDYEWPEVAGSNLFSSNKAEGTIWHDARAH